MDGIEDSVQPLPRSDILRLLQDVCSRSQRLPDKYSLSDVKVHAERISIGGEAVIFSGSHQGRAVAIREIFPPQDENWSSPKGVEILKASMVLLKYRQGKSTRASLHF